MIEYSTIAPYLFVDDAPAVEEFMKNKATLTKFSNKDFVLDVASIGTYRLQSRQQAIAMILSLLDGVTYTRQGRVSFESGDKYMCMVKGTVATRKRTRAEVGGQSEEMMGVGRRVSAAYPDGFMYPATIVKVNRVARTYKVRWDDADEAHQLVKMDDVEPLAPAEDAAAAAEAAAVAAEDARDGERVGTILRTAEEDEMLFLLQEKLQRSDEALQRSEEALQRSQGELQRSQGELKQTQGELKQCRAELQRSEGDLMITQEEVLRCHVVMVKTDEELKKTQGELKKTEGERQRSQGDADLLRTVEELNEKLRLAEGQIRTYLVEIELSHEELRRSREEFGLSHEELRQAREELGRAQGELEGVRERLTRSDGEVRQYLVEIELSHEELERAREELKGIREELEQAREELGRAVVCETTLQVKLNAAVSASQIARNDTKRVQKDMKGLLVKTSEMRVEMESATALARDAAARSDRMAQERLAFCAKVEALEAALRDLRGTLSPADTQGLPRPTPVTGVGAS